MKIIALAAALALSACSQVQPVVPDYAQLRPGAFGTGADPDVTAANLAVYAFSASSRTYGRPIDGARAAAALEYMAGAFYTSPRWNNISALTKEQLLQGRDELRGALKVAPGARSQQIVDSLMSAADALQDGNEPAAVAALDSRHAFAVPGAQELQIVGNLPYLRMANIATQHASGELFNPDDPFITP